MKDDLERSFISRQGTYKDSNYWSYMSREDTITLCIDVTREARLWSYQVRWNQSGRDG